MFEIASLATPQLSSLLPPRRLAYYFPRRHQWPAGLRRSNLALPDIVRHAARCHLGQKRLSSFGSRSDLSLRQRRNDGIDSRQLSIQSCLQFLEGGLDFRWRPAIALSMSRATTLLILSVMVPVAILTSYE
jgi:hypothetical protein